MLSLKQLSCQAAADELSQVLDAHVDYEGESGGIGITAFRHDLVELLQRPETAPYLRDTIRYFAEHKDSAKRSNFWQWNLMEAHGDRDLALKRIAVLFQDSSEGTHLSYLEVLYSDRLPKGSLQLLTQAIHDFNSATGLSYYPAPIRVPVNSQYHFYAMAYIARKLAARTGIDRTMASIAPTLLNTAYETTKHQPDNPDKDPPKLVLGLFRDPRPLRPDEKQDDWLEDSYLGYAGSLWGTEDEGKIKDFETFKKEYGRDPNGFIRALFK